MKTANANRWILLGAGIAVLVAVSLAFATAARGTGAGDTQEIAKLKSQIATLQTQLKDYPVLRSQVAVLSVSTRIAFIDAAGIHAMEAKGQNLTTRDVSAVQNVLAVTAKVGWPEALKEDARQLVATCRNFLAAWNAGNKAEAAEALKAAHTAYHALTASGYKWLS